MADRIDLENQIDFEKLEQGTVLLYCHLGAIDIDTEVSVSYLAGPDRRGNVGFTRKDGAIGVARRECFSLLPKITHGRYLKFTQDDVFMARGFPLPRKAGDLLFRIWLEDGELKSDPA